MSSSASSTQPATLEKAVVEAKAEEIAPTTTAVTYQLDGVDDDIDEYHNGIKIDRADRRDMQRMGKIQELRVI